MSPSTVSVRYTEALIDAAQERQVLDNVVDDVQALLDLFRESEALSTFIADPMMRSDRKRTVLNSLLSGKIQDISLNFILLLCDNHREHIFKELLADFLSIQEERRGILTAYVTIASALSSEQEEQLANKLSAYSGKQVRLETTLDEGLKAGFIARLGDQVFDGTLATQLNRLRKRLTVGV